LKLIPTCLNTLLLNQVLDIGLLENFNKESLIIFCCYLLNLIQNVQVCIETILKQVQHMVQYKLAIGVK
jgi:hypothetical protein